MGHFVMVLEVSQIKRRFPEQYRRFERLGGRLLKSFPKAPSFALTIIRGTFYTRVRQESRNTETLVGNGAECGVFD
jgi:hypothetical protein